MYAKLSYGHKKQSKGVCASATGRRWAASTTDELCAKQTLRARFTSARIAAFVSVSSSRGLIRGSSHEGGDGEHDHFAPFLVKSLKIGKTPLVVLGS